MDDYHKSDLNLAPTHLHSQATWPIASSVRNG